LVFRTVCSCAFYSLLFGNGLGKLTSPALAAPILMIPVVGGFLWLVEDKNPVASALEYATYCLGVGYAYVGVTLLGLWLLIGTDRLKNETRTANPPLEPSASFGHE
jgi:hypothetical protein